MNIEKYIEHRDITNGKNKLHPPFRWEVENADLRDSFTPLEDDKLLLQRDTQRVYVSDSGRFYPITLDSAPHDGRLYGMLGQEWTPLLLPVDDDFRPPEVQTSMNLYGFLSINVDYNSSSYWLSSDSINNSNWYNTSHALPYHHRIGVCLENIHGNSLVIEAIRHINDGYALATFIDTYYFNNTSEDINIIIPVIGTNVNRVLKPNQVLRVVFTFHEYSNVTTAITDLRDSSGYTKNCMPFIDEPTIIA